MSEQRSYASLKVGLVVVAVAYFLFTFHAVFTLEWIGEWESMTKGGFVILVEDIFGLIGLVFRLVASFTALFGLILYLVKRGLSESRTTKIFRVIFIGEAIYWLGLLPSGALPLIYFRDFSNSSVILSIIAYELPALVESTAIPVALFMLSFKINPDTTRRRAIKWSLITGTVYIFVFWLVNMGIWILTIRTKGIEYLTSYPENLLSFALTVFGLLSLALYAARFTVKSAEAETINTLNLRTVGAVICFLGLWFLWNYLTWILFGKAENWSDWYRWFLGHNMDLWMLSIPLVGLPLRFLNGSFTVRMRPQALSDN